MGASVSRQGVRRSQELKRPLKLAQKRGSRAAEQQEKHSSSARPANWHQRLSFRSQKVHAASPETNNTEKPAAASHSIYSWWKQEETTDDIDDDVLQQDVACQVDITELASNYYSTTASVDPAPIKWRKGERIGCGAYGSVYMGLNSETGELLAVKEIAQCVRESHHQHEAVQQLEQEVALLSKLSHPNVLRYLGTAREGSSLYIFLEYVPGGSIASVVSRFGPLDEPIIRSYTRQLLAGLAYLHAQRIVHRDIKGANLLVEKDGLVKLADMGMAKEMEAISVTKSFKGSPFWMAPEVVRQQGHGWPADIWSVGCTVLEMATGKPPWSECTTQVQAIFKIASSNEVPAIPELLSPAAADFIKQCLQRNPHHRPTAQQLLQHPWVAGVDVHVPPALALQLPQQELALLSNSNASADGLNPAMAADTGSVADDDAAQADAGRIRPTKAAQNRAQQPQQQHPPWLAGKPRTTSPKRNRTTTAAGVAAAGSAAGIRTWSVTGKPAGAGSPAAAAGSSKQQVLRQQLSRGSAPGLLTPNGLAGVGLASAGAASPPGGFRRIRSRTVTAEDPGCPPVPEEAVNFSAEQLLSPVQTPVDTGLIGACNNTP